VGLVNREAAIPSSLYARSVRELYVISVTKMAEHVRNARLLRSIRNSIVMKKKKKKFDRPRDRIKDIEKKLDKLEEKLDRIIYILNYDN